jgi:hypothetical protein
MSVFGNLVRAPILRAFDYSDRLRLKPHRRGRRQTETSSWPRLTRVRLEADSGGLSRDDFSHSAMRSSPVPAVYWLVASAAPA